MRSMQTRAARQYGGRPPARQPQTAPRRLSPSSQWQLLGGGSQCRTATPCANCIPSLEKVPWGVQMCSKTPLQAVTCCLRTSLEHGVPSHLQNVTLGSCSSFGSCGWGSSDPASQGREQEGRGTLSSGVATDSSETSLSCVNLSCAVDLLLVIRIALWVAAEAGTQPTHVVDIWKYFCSPQDLLAVRTVGWGGEGSCNLHTEFETMAGEDIHPIRHAG